MSKPKQIPKWQERLNNFQPAFPGDGFNHEFAETVKLFANNEKRGHLVKCPCGQTSCIESDNLIRAKGSVDVLTCPQCLSWHVVTWLIEYTGRVMGGNFIFVGKLAP